MLRQPIVTVLGHVDHGKTTLLDRIRRTSVQRKEAGGITQHIGASEVPIDVIKRIAEPLLEKIKVSFKIPGLLFIDTPGHEAFTNLRKRGGSIADIAVLVVDINKGFQPQTYEALNILKTYRVPFIVAANKVDTIPGWNPHEDSPITLSLKKQREDVVEILDRKVYDIVSALAAEGFSSERFDRVRDFTKEVLIIPTSGVTGEGIPELLLYLVGLSQRFLENRLHLDEKLPGKGVILEIKEDVGIGKTGTVILYQGSLKRGDGVVFLTKEGIRKTYVKAIFRPKPLDEIRSPRDKFKPVPSVVAAAGVKVAAPGMEDAIPGSPFYVYYEGVEKDIEREMEEVEFSSEREGVIVKADTLGTLEAVVKLLKDRNIPIRKAEIGPVTRRDVVEADSVRNRYLRVILAFNVDIDRNAELEALSKNVFILSERVIYRLLELYEEFVEKEREREKRELLERLVIPAKLEILPGYIFRRSNPAIVGVRIIEGILKPDTPLMREDGKVVGRVRSIQSEGRSLDMVKGGDEVAISIEGAVVGRHIKEGDILYSDVPKEHAKEILRHLDLFPAGTKELLKEIMEIRKGRE